MMEHGFIAPASTSRPWTRRPKACPSCAYEEADLPSCPTASALAGPTPLWCSASSRLDESTMSRKRRRKAPFHCVIVSPVAAVAVACGRTLAIFGEGLAGAGRLKPCLRQKAGASCTATRPACEPFVCSKREGGGEQPPPYALAAACRETARSQIELVVAGQALKGDGGRGAGGHARGGRAGSPAPGPDVQPPSSRRGASSACCS